MANNITAEQIDKLERLYNVTGLMALFCMEESEWKAIVILQNMLDSYEIKKCFDYLDNHEVGFAMATIDQRVEALIQTKMKS